MQTEPKVAFLIPVHNSAAHLSKCINSLLTQSYRNFIIIAIDDGSSDESLKILQSYSKKYCNIKILTQTNKGPSAARNSGLKYIENDASIDYISFIDSDDYISSDFLEQHIQSLQQSESDISVCGYTYVRQQCDQHKTKPFASLKIMDQFEFICLIFGYYPWQTLNGAGGMVWKQVFRSNIVRGIRFLEDRDVVEDELFCLEVAERVRKVVYIPKAIYHYCQQSTSLSNKIEFNLNLAKGRERCLQFSTKFPKEIEFIIFTAFLDAVFYAIKDKPNQYDISHYEHLAYASFNAKILSLRKFLKFLFLIKFPNTFVNYYKIRTKFYYFKQKTKFLLNHSQNAN